MVRDKPLHNFLFETDPHGFYARLACCWTRWEHFNQKEFCMDACSQRERVQRTDACFDSKGGSRE